jgi:hypothetical protein
VEEEAENYEMQLINEKNINIITGIEWYGEVPIHWKRDKLLPYLSQNGTQKSTK